MPFQKGHKKSGGRKKGSINKDTQALAECAARLGVDPFEILCLFAKGDWEALGYESEFELKIAAGGTPVNVRVISPELRSKNAAEAAQYIHPKKKAIEHSGPDGGPIEVGTKVDLSGLSKEELKILRSVMSKSGDGKPKQD